MEKGNLTSNFTLTTTPVVWRIARWRRRRRPWRRNCYRRCGRGIGRRAVVAKNGWARYIALRLQLERKREIEKISETSSINYKSNKVAFSVNNKVYRVMLAIRYDPPPSRSHKLCVLSVIVQLAGHQYRLSIACRNQQVASCAWKFLFLLRKCYDFMSLSLSS